LTSVPITAISAATVAVAAILLGLAHGALLHLLLVLHLLLLAFLRADLFGARALFAPGFLLGACLAFRVFTLMALGLLLGLGLALRILSLLAVLLIPGSIPLLPFLLLLAVPISALTICAFTVATFAVRTLSVVAFAVRPIWTPAVAIPIPISGIAAVPIVPVAVTPAAIPVGTMVLVSIAAPPLAFTEERPTVVMIAPIGIEREGEDTNSDVGCHVLQGLACILIVRHQFVARDPAPVIAIAHIAPAPVVETPEDFDAATIGDNTDGGVVIVGTGMHFSVAHDKSGGGVCPVRQKHRRGSGQAQGCEAGARHEVLHYVKRFLPSNPTLWHRKPLDSLMNVSGAREGTCWAGARLQAGPAILQHCDMDKA